MNAMLLLQVKLTEGLSLAKDFHSSVQELLTKMTKCEDKTRLLSAPSFVLESVCNQLEKHNVCLFIQKGMFVLFYKWLQIKFVWFEQELVKEVNGYCEKKTTVENIGCRLTEMSRKEDCDVIHNLIMTVQDRYKRLQQRVTDRGRFLEEAKKSAKQVECVNIVPI